MTGAASVPWAKKTARATIDVWINVVNFTMAVVVAGGQLG